MEYKTVYDGVPVTVVCDDIFNDDAPATVLIGGVDVTCMMQSLRVVEWSRYECKYITVGTPFDRIIDQVIDKEMGRD